MGEKRLQKYLSEAGVSSRRMAENIIKQGRVSVNNLVVTDMGVKVSEADLVEVDGKKIEPEDNKVYIMMNKPVGVITSVKDQFSRKTVIDLLEGFSERVFPVGRLDYNTSGLLLLTNDGEFAFKLTHPGHEVKKTYIAEVSGIPADKDIFKLCYGLAVDGFMTSPAEVKVVECRQKSSILEITIHEGRNRQIRKMFELIGHPVIKLKRISIGSLSLSDLKEGSWRFLTGPEVAKLGLPS